MVFADVLVDTRLMANPHVLLLSVVGVVMLPVVVARTGVVGVERDRV